MPDPILIILFIVFFILPLLEKALKKGQQPPQQKPRPPRHDAELEQQQRDALPGGRTAPPQADDAAEPAADMIPDDLWEILTGERRPRAPEPQPLPRGDAGGRGYEADRYDSWLEGFDRDVDTAADQPVYESEIAGDEIGADEVDAAERLRAEREHAVHTAERAPRRDADLVIYDPGAHSPVRRAPIASPSVLPTRSGRAAARLEQQVATARAAPRARPQVVPGLRGAGLDELRRAFVLKEILDRPKGFD